MNELADDMNTLGKQFINPRIVQPAYALNYLTRDLNLEIVASFPPHGAAPSTADLLATVKQMRKTNPGAICLSVQYGSDIGQMLSKETSVPLVMIDQGASGPKNAPLDYFETVMRKNMEALRATLGVNP